MVTDQDHLRAGDNWLGTIENALKSSEIILSLLSKRSITKPWVNFEAGAGWLAGKRVMAPLGDAPRRLVRGPPWRDPLPRLAIPAVGRTRSDPEAPMDQREDHGHHRQR